jgi:hypothetical protein
LSLGLAAALLAGLHVATLGDPALPGILLLALLLGAAFVRFDFGFTAAFAAFAATRDGRALASTLAIPAIAALLVLPLGGTGMGYERAVAPIGPALIAGAALFGLGMTLARGCGSGCLVAAGALSWRMWLALACFCLGGVLGSLLLPAALRLPGLGPVDLMALLGPWGALAATEAGLLALALALLRGARPDPSRLAGAALIGLLAALLFLVWGEPWGITMGLTVAGARALGLFGIDLSDHAFWAADAAGRWLRGPLLAMPSALADLGLLLGALIATAARGQMRAARPLGARDAAGAALGGLLMGIGARLAFGCNIGAFVGGLASGSLHGLAWFLAALPGVWLGLRLRPAFDAAAPLSPRSAGSHASRSGRSSA